MKTKAFLSILMLISAITFGQVTGPEQDCISAIPVCDPVYVQINSYQGTGLIEEIGNGLSCLENGENNSVWYAFEIAADGILEFTIAALSGTQDTVDYDFALYDITGATCSDIQNGGVEVRCNYTFTDSITGLRTGYTETAASSTGPPFLAPLAEKSSPKTFKTKGQPLT